MTRFFSVTLGPRAEGPYLNCKMDPRVMPEDDGMIYSRDVYDEATLTPASLQGSSLSQNRSWEDEEGVFTLRQLMRGAFRAQI